MVDHLSRLSNTKTQDTPINDFLRDDMLLKVTTSHPWYANILNFMVSEYLPLGESKKKLAYESRLNLCDALYLYRVCADRLLRRLYPWKKDKRSYKNAMQHHMEITMVCFALKQKSSRVDSFGRRCMKTPKTSYGDAEIAISREELRPALRCP